MVGNMLLGSIYIALLCELLPLRFELACCSARVIVKCICSENYVVSALACNGVYFSHAQSLIGRNALFCCSLFKVPLHKLCAIYKQLRFLLPTIVYLTIACTLLTWSRNYCVWSVNSSNFHLCILTATTMTAWLIFCVLHSVIFSSLLLCEHMYVVIIIIIYTHQPDTPPIVICFATDSFERSAKKRRTAALFEFCLGGNIPE